MKKLGKDAGITEMQPNLTYDEYRQRGKDAGFLFLCISQSLTGKTKALGKSSILAWSQGERAEWQFGK